MDVINKVKTRQIHNYAIRHKIRYISNSNVIRKRCNAGAIEAQIGYK